VLLFYISTAFAIYGPYLANPFIMDDESQIIENEQIKSFDHFAQYFTSSTMGSGGAAKMGGVYYKPLMTTYYSSIWHFFGARPDAFRAPLLTLHAISAFLIFLLSRGYFREEKAVIWSFFIGLLFLVHPVNSEVVLYIADAQDILYMFFGLLGLMAVQCIKTRAVLFAVLTCTLSFSVLSKETGILFLAITPAFALLNRPVKPATVLMPSAFVLSLYLWIRITLGLTETKSSQLLFHQATYFERLSMLPLTLSHYIEIFFIPWRISLTTDFILHDLNWSNFFGPLLTCILALVCFAVMALRLRKLNASGPLWFFTFILALWFLLHGHTLVPLDGVYTDRWLYLATWPVLSLLALWLEREISRQHKRNYLSKAALVFTLMISLAFATRSSLRAKDWSDPLNFYRREIEIHPWDAIMNNNVGVELFRRGQYNDSQIYFEKAAELNPHWNVAWNNLAAFYERTGNDSRAGELYLKSLDCGDYPLAYENYAKLLFRNHRLSEAREFLTARALPRLPQNPTLLKLQKILTESSAGE
jgi:hypothetical protein